MEKKIVYIGIGLIILSIVVLFINGYNTSTLSSNLQSALIVNNLTVSSNSFNHLAMNVTSNSYIFAIVELSSPANIYLFNSSGYHAWSGAVGSVCNTVSNVMTCSEKNGLATAISLENKGAFYIFKNSINATVPVSLTPVATSPLYSINQSTLYAAGTYYFVIDNTNGSASANNKIQARVVYLPPLTNSSATSGPFAGLSSEINQELVYGLLFFVFLLAGVILIIYGFIKKPKGEVSAPIYGKPQKPDKSMDQDYVNQLYKDVDARKKAKKSSRKQSA